MKKRNIHKKQGIVDLNKARPSVKDNNSRFFKKKTAKNNEINASATLKTSEKSINNDKTHNSVKSKKNAKSQYTKVDKDINSISTSKPLNTAGKTSFLKRNENGKLLISRRKLIYGAVGLGVLAAGAGAAKFSIDKFSKDTNTQKILTVPKTNVINSDTLVESESKYFEISKSISLPYGSLAWANSSDIIACLIPTTKAKPLAKVDIICISDEERYNVLENSVGQKKGFEIYDVRANDNGIIWAEVNILQGEWRIYCSKFDKNFNVIPVLVDKGNKDWDTPTICVSGNFAYWQILPDISGDNNKMLSSLKKISFSNLQEDKNSFICVAENNKDIKDNQYTVYTSDGRMTAPVYGYKDGVIISPRADSKNIYYELTYLSTDDKVLDKLMLHQNMKPQDVAYGDTGFNFTLDAIYNNNEGISNLGTYTPMSKNADGYNNLTWLNFSRNPSVAPAWSNGLFIIRSTMSIIAVNLKQNNYQILDRPNASDDYGDYLASSGNVDNIVTYANIYDNPISGDELKFCSLRIWKKV